MKRRPPLLISFALLFLPLAVAGCAHKPTIVGKWQGTTTTQGGAVACTLTSPRTAKKPSRFKHRRPGFHRHGR